MYNDAGKRPLPPLQPGDHVMLQSEKEMKWQPATVVPSANEHRSFIVQDTLKKRYSRNRRFSRKLPERETSTARGETTNNTPPDTTQGTTKPVENQLKTLHLQQLMKMNQLGHQQEMPKNLKD